MPGLRTAPDESGFKLPSGGAVHSPAIQRRAEARLLLKYAPGGLHMTTPALRLCGGIAILGAFLALSPSAAADEQSGEAFFDPGEVVGFKPADAIAPEQLKEIRA